MNSDDMMTTAVAYAASSNILANSSIISNNMPILRCNKLYKNYQQGPGADNQLTILRDINLAVAPGETVSIVGSSGSGKSTLLHLLAGLSRPTSGEIIIAKTSFNGLNDSQICALRNKCLGFVYQFHHLLPEFTALENVLMPIVIHTANCCGDTSINYTQHAKELLKCLDLGQRLHHYPSELSGGERQRVAIARAVINNPQIIFADEPTGNLDNTTATQVLDIFFRLQQELNTSLIMVTHDIELAKRTQTCYNLHDGNLSLA